MRRAVSVLGAGSWDPSAATATVTLDYDARHRRRFRHRSDDGSDLLLDLKRAQLLNDGDGLLLDDGGMVRVVAAAEPLLEVTPGPAANLGRLAYHLGNRHLPVQLGSERILIRVDHVIAEMVVGLGGQIREVTEAFTPEPGAYDGAERPASAGHADHGHHHHGHDHDQHAHLNHHHHD